MEDFIKITTPVREWTVLQQKDGTAELALAGVAEMSDSRNYPVIRVVDVRNERTVAYERLAFSEGRWAHTLRLATGMYRIETGIALQKANFKPYDLDEMGPCLLMYLLEAYSAGMPKLIADHKRAEAIRARWQEALEWMQANQGGRGSGHKWSDYSTQWGSKFGGLPFHIFMYARAVRGNDRLRTAADAELVYVTKEIAKDAKPGLSQLAAFAMMSYAERISPGALYRSSRASTQPVREH
jgi:hypothetical protein